MPPVLQILLLGPPEVRWEGKLLSIQRRIPRALLFYLAWRGGMVGRNELLALFWEEESEKEARSRLRESLSRLRQSLPQPDLLLVENDLIGLDPAITYIDHSEFQRLLSQAGREAWNSSGQQPLPEHTVQCLRQAAALWRGPHFMAGVKLPESASLDDWLQNTTQYLDVLYSRLLDRLAGHAEAIGDLEQCLNDTLQAVRVNDLEEGFHERLMRVWIRMGRRDQARRHYQMLSEHLARELGIQPMQSLQALYRQACDNTPPLQRRQSFIEWNIHPAPLTPFIGRQADLARLQQCYEQGQSVFVVGEAGSGKTRLVKEFVERLHPKPEVVVGRCNPAEMDQPLQALVQMERHYGLNTDKWGELPATLVSQIFPFLPELARIRPDAIQARSSLSAVDRSLVFEAIRHLLLYLSRDQRLIAVLDDLQWADEMSLEALTVLLERPPFNGRAMFVATLRSEETNSKIEKVIKPLQESGRLVIIELPNLMANELAELVEKISPLPSSPRWLDRLRRYTGGNVLYTLKTLQAALEQPVDGVAKEFPLEKSIAALLRNRLAALPEDARQVLEAAAILGPQFDPTLLLDILQISIQSLVHSLETLEQRQLIEAAPSLSARSAYRFVHEVVRQIIMDDLPHLQAQRLHRQAAQILESKLEEQIASQATDLAYHYEHAGDPLSAFRYYLQTGINLHQRYHPVSEAVQAFADAERMLGVIKFRAPDDELYRWYKNWFDLAYETGDVSTLHRLTALLLDLGWQRHSPLLIGSALTGMGKIALTMIQFQQGLNYINQALPYLQCSHNQLAYLDAFQHQAIFYSLSNRLTEAEQGFQQALALCTESQDHEVIGIRADIYCQLGILQTLRGWPLEGEKYAMLALTDTLMAKRAGTKPSVYNLLALTQCLLGDPSQARQNTQLGIEIAERLHSWRVLGYLYVSRSAIELNTGDLGAAWRFATLALEMGERHHYPDLICCGYCSQADLLAALQAYPSAVDLYRRSLEVSRDGLWGLKALISLGDALCQAGHVSEGMETLRQAIEQTDAGGLGLLSMFGRLSQLTAMVAQGGGEQVGATLESLQAASQQHGLRSLGLESSYLQGKIVSQLSNPQSALERFAAVAQSAAEISHPWIEIRALASTIEGRESLGLLTFAQRERLASRLASLEASLAVAAPADEACAARQAFRSFRDRFTL